MCVKIKKKKKKNPKTWEIVVCKGIIKHVNTQVQPLSPTWRVANSTSGFWWSRKRTSPGRQPWSWTITSRFCGSEARSRSWLTTDSASIIFVYFTRPEIEIGTLTLLKCGFTVSMIKILTLSDQQNILTLCGRLKNSNEEAIVIYLLRSQFEVFKQEKLHIRG